MLLLGLVAADVARQSDTMATQIAGRVVIGGSVQTNVN
jgi:hypothetical protein